MLPLKYLVKMPLRSINQTFASITLEHNRGTMLLCFTLLCLNLLR
jgi:hypothetical protein